MFFFSFLLHRNVVEPLKGKLADISRPLNESFRHTGHGSVLGQSWGNPTFLDPAYMGDVELRGSAVASKDVRKKKCASEQYVRERKSNATKQFAYNKLKNEKHMSLNQQQQQKLSKSSSASVAPKRPPQPKFDGSGKEGMLIDLSPPIESPAMSGTNQRINMNMSILDAPIDVPTEGENSTVTAAEFIGESNKMEPPPYHSPPTYMNTYGLGQAFNPLSSSTSDPFDTSHIVPHKSYSPLTISNVIAAKPTNGTSMVRQRPSAASPKTQLDELVQNTMASLSPKSSHSSLNSIDLSAKANLTQWRTSNTANQSDANVDGNRTNSPLRVANSSSDTLNDSMNVNLSSSTLHDTDADLSTSGGDLMSSFGRTEPTKIDKTFLAELEKEMYKNETAMSKLNVNMSVASNNQHHNGKEYSVTAIPSEMYGNRVHNETMSPSRLTHSQVKAINEEIVYAKSTYDSEASIGQNFYSPNSSRKQFNADTSSADMSVTSNPNLARPLSAAAPALTSDRPMSMAEINEAVRSQAIYSNFAMSNVYSNAAQSAAEQQHNFVAVSNWPQSTTTPSMNNVSRANYSVTSDIYGSIAGGNVYDVVAAPQSSNSSAYYGIVMPTMAEVHSKPIDYYETTSNGDPQSVIYDEVAGEDLLRPHRPAPNAPPVLSAQQIQRRIERAQKEQQMYGNIGGHYQPVQSNGFDGVDAIGHQHQKVMALISAVAGDGGDTNEHESRQALIAANWDHTTAVRNLKIERLLR